MAATSAFPIWLACSKCDSPKTSLIFVLQYLCFFPSMLDSCMGVRHTAIFEKASALEMMSNGEGVSYNLLWRSFQGSNQALDKPEVPLSLTDFKILSKYV